MKPIKKHVQKMKARIKELKARMKAAEKLETQLRRAANRAERLAFDQTERVDALSIRIEDLEMDLQDYLELPKHEEPLKVPGVRGMPYGSKRLPGRHRVFRKGRMRRGGR